MKPVDAVGGERAAQVALKGFIRKRLSRYMAERNEPEASATSGLSSAYLHFGHIGARGRGENPRARKMDAETTIEEDRRAQERLVGRIGRRRGISRPTRHVAGTRI